MSMSHKVGPPSILRLRAGLLLLATVSLFSISAGRFAAVTFGLGWVWGLVLVLAVLVLLAFAIWRLTRKVYLIIAAAVTALTTYFAYDFLQGALGLSSTTALVLSLVPLVVVGAAFWDFLRLKEEIRRWLNSR